MKTAPPSRPPRIAARRLSMAIPHVQDIAMLMDTYHSDSFWAEIGSRCLNCTACAAVCPTCMCFDIKDILSPDAKTGERVRTWDSCNSPHSPALPAGHNFRADERAGAFVIACITNLTDSRSKHGSMLCVGCGHCCVNACKVNINPIEVFKFFDEKTRSSAVTDKEANDAE